MFSTELNDAYGFTLKDQIETVEQIRNHVISLAS